MRRLFVVFVSVLLPTFSWAQVLENPVDPSVFRESTMSAPPLSGAEQDAATKVAAFMYEPALGKIVASSLPTVSQQLRLSDPALSVEQLGRISSPEAGKRPPWYKDWQFIATHSVMGVARWYDTEQTVKGLARCEWCEEDNPWVKPFSGNRWSLRLGEVAVNGLLLWVDSKLRNDVHRGGKVGRVLSLLIPSTMAVKHFQAGSHWNTVGSCTKKQLRTACEK